MPFLNKAFEDSWQPQQSSGSIASPLSSGAGNPVANVSGSNYSSASSTSNTDNTATVGPGAVNLREAELNTGFQLGTVGGNVTFNGGADILAASNADWFNALGAVSASYSDTVEKALSSLTDLSESSQTDGASQTKQYVFWGGVVALIVAGVYFLNRKG